MIIQSDDYNLYADDCINCKFNRFYNLKNGRYCKKKFRVKDWENPDLTVENDCFGTRRIDDNDNFIHCADFIYKKPSRRENLSIEDMGKNKWTKNIF